MEDDLYREVLFVIKNGTHDEVAVMDSKDHELNG